MRNLYWSNQSVNEMPRVGFLKLLTNCYSKSEAFKQEDIKIYSYKRKETTEIIKSCTAPQMEYKI